MNLAMSKKCRATKRPQTAVWAKEKARTLAVRTLKTKSPKTRASRTSWMNKKRNSRSQVKTMNSCPSRTLFKTSRCTLLYFDLWTIYYST